MIDEAMVICPWCGESIALTIDRSAGNQSYTEDCSVCCNPMTVAVRVDDNAELAGVEVAREGE